MKTCAKPLYFDTAATTPVAAEVRACMFDCLGDDGYYANPAAQHAAGRAAAASGDHHLLRDHFRCHDDIADYISETFYGHRLLRFPPPFP